MRLMLIAAAGVSLVAAAASMARGQAPGGPAGAAPDAQATKTGDLKAGDAAPAFSLMGSDDKIYTLEQFKGRSAVVLAWFPKAFTGG